MRTQIQKDCAGALEFIAEHGPVTAASVELFESGSTALVASPTAVVDPLDETITVAAAAADDRVTVADTSDVVLDRPCWLEASDGRGRIVMPRGKTADVVIFDSPIGLDCDTSSSIKGHLVTVALSALQTAETKRRCEARWAVTVDGVVYRRTTRFDIVERPFALVVDEELIEQAWPRFGEYVTAGRQGWRKHVEGAKRSIELWLNSLRIESDEMREPANLEWLAAHMVAAAVAKDLERDALLAAIERIKGEIRESETWVDTNNDLAADPDEVGPVIRYATVT